MVDNQSATVAVEQQLQYHFQDKTLLEQALTHKSKSSVNYERLEFLGDAIWRKLVAVKLFNQFPEYNEKQLTIDTSELVSQSCLANLCSQLQLEQWLLIGSSAVENIRQSAKVRCDLFEALLGALYLDGGYAICEQLVERSVRELHDKKAEKQRSQDGNCGQLLAQLQPIISGANLQFNVAFDQGEAVVSIERDNAVLLTSSAKSTVLAKCLVTMQYLLVEQSKDESAYSQYCLITMLEQTGCLVSNPKSQLQEYFQLHKMAIPIYRQEQHSDNVFFVSCTLSLEESPIFTARALTKRTAEKHAALKALLYLNRL